MEPKDKYNNVLIFHGNIALKESIIENSILFNRNVYSIKTMWIFLTEVQCHITYVTIVWSMIYSNLRFVRAIFQYFVRLRINRAVKQYVFVGHCFPDGATWRVKTHSHPNVINDTRIKLSFADFELYNNNNLVHYVCLFGYRRNNSFNTKLHYRFFYAFLVCGRNEFSDF